jgi:hypothetical protein
MDKFIKWLNSSISVLAGRWNQIIHGLIINSHGSLFGSNSTTAYELSGAALGLVVGSVPPLVVSLGMLTLCLIMLHHQEEPHREAPVHTFQTNQPFISHQLIWHPH